MKHLIIILLIFFSGWVEAQRNNPDLQNMQVVWQLINNFYVDTVNHRALSRAAITAMLKQLDPHSTFIPAEDVKAMNEQLQGNFEGIGIEFMILNDTLTVANPIIGGPSEKAGIQSGDRIIAVDGENITTDKITTPDVYKLLRGQKGSIVNLTVMRKNERFPHEFRITRDKIPINSIDAASMLTPHTAYIKISRFALNTHSEFCTALKELKKENPQNLVIDLRGNAGGYLKAALDIADELLESGKLMLYTQGKSSTRMEYTSTRGGLWEKGRLLLLIDEGSASASEILSGALQDHDRAIVMGRRSFGKGLVQRPFLLPDKSEMRLTVAKYYTPSGRSIQKPYSNNEKQYHDEILNRVSLGELTNRDSIHLREDLKFKTLHYHRTVYGGGGIMPDVFVPLDTSMVTGFYRNLLSTGTLNLFMAGYTDANRKTLQALYPCFDAYNSNFEPDTALFSSLLAQARSAGITARNDKIKISETYIKMQIKAYIARQLWSNTEYFRIVNQSSPAVVNALKLIEEKDEYNNILTGQNQQQH